LEISISIFKSSYVKESLLIIFKLFRNLFNIFFIFFLSNHFEFGRNLFLGQLLEIPSLLVIKFFLERRYFFLDYLSVSLCRPVRPVVHTDRAGMSVFINRHEPLSLLNSFSNLSLSPSKVFQFQASPLWRFGFSSTENSIPSGDLVLLSLVSPLSLS
jgi:hypothetical protein